MELAFSPLCQIDRLCKLDASQVRCFAAVRNNRHPELPVHTVILMVIVVMVMVLVVEPFEDIDCVGKHKTKIQEK